MKSGFRMLCYILPLGAFVFIIVNAVTPAEQSEAATWAFINTFLGRGLRDAMAILGGTVPDNQTVFETARTIAHIGEYAFLGLTAYLALRLNIEHIPNIVYLLFFGVMTALLDETLQSYTAGRAAQVSDILLDFIGFGAVTLLCPLLDRLFSGQWVTSRSRRRRSYWS